MAASRKTVDAILQAMRKHLSEQQIRNVVRELLSVEGNRSFIKTVRALWQLVRPDRPAEGGDE